LLIALADHGTTLSKSVFFSDRSAIFHTSDEQKRIAEDTIADIKASGL
jgi:peptide methionine sulfoxide reductase MsrA